MVRCTQVPGGAIGGSAEAFENEKQPLIHSKSSGDEFIDDGSLGMRETPKRAINGLSSRYAVEAKWDSKYSKRKLSATPLNIINMHEQNEAARGSFTMTETSSQMETISTEGYEGSSPIASSVNLSELGVDDINIGFEKKTETKDDHELVYTDNMVTPKPRKEKSVSFDQNAWTNHDFSEDVAPSVSSLDVQNMHVERKTAWVPEMLADGRDTQPGLGAKSRPPKHSRAISAAVAAALNSNANETGTRLILFETYVLYPH